MFSATEYYRQRLLDRDQRVNIIINSINNNKKRKYDEAFLDISHVMKTPIYKPYDYSYSSLFLSRWNNSFFY